MRPSSLHDRGFTLLEVLIGFAIGLVVLAGAAQLYSKAMDVSDQLNAQGEMQQNARAGINSVVQDVSLAGTGGMPQTGIALPSGNGATNPAIACDNTPKCYVISGGSSINFSDAVLHVITPLGKVGQNNAAGTSGTDVVTLAFGDSDPNFQIDCKPLTSIVQTPASGTPTSFKLTLDPTTFSAACPAAPSPAMNPLLTPSDGLVVGDVLALSNVNGMAAAVVTGITESAGSHTVTLGSTDLLSYNQFGGTAGTLTTNLSNKNSNPPVYPSTSVFRIWVVSYFVYKQPDGTLRLMRQVNARPPVPVAENVDDFIVTYDTYDQNTSVDKANLDASQVFSPPTTNNANNIRKVNLQLTVRSSKPIKGQYQHFRLITSVDPRALGYQDRYQ